MDINSKKISLSILFLAITLFVYIHLAKDYTSNIDSALLHIRKLSGEVPLNLYTVKILFVELNFVTAIVLNCLLFGLGLYLLLFRTDGETKELITVYQTKFLKKAQENQNLFRTTKLDSVVNVKPEKKLDKNVKNNTALRAFLILSILFTFIGCVKTSFYISFFLPLSYYYYIDLEPKSTRSLAFKTILYPLLFAIPLVLLNGNFKALSSYPYSSVISYYLGQETVKIIIPYLICVIISYFYLNRRMIHNRYPTYKPGYLTLVGIFVLLGMLKFLAEIYIETAVEDLQF